MYTTTRLLSAAAALISVASASFIQPASNATWALNTEQMVQWETAGLQEPLQMYLCPGGSTDISQSIQTLAPSIENTGWWKWQPTTSIPYHQTFIIIIVDSGKHHKISDPFKMIGWPQQTYEQTYAPPAAHTSIILHTSVIHQQPSLVVSQILVTSHVAPIIMTSEVAPIIQTETVAPIIVTHTQEPITKIESQAPIVQTETQAPIVKTILVTETPAPIIKTISQEPITKIESQAPIIKTQTQAPIIKTIAQPPHVITEQQPPVVITSHVTHTIQPPPIHTVITEHVIIQPHTTYNTYPPQHTTVNEHTTVIEHTTPSHEQPATHTSIAVLTPVVPSYPAGHTAPIYQNGTTAASSHSASTMHEGSGSTSTSVEVPTFEKPTSVAESSSVATTFQTGTMTTAPPALMATQSEVTFPAGGTAPSTGAGTRPTGIEFTGAASSLKGSGLMVGVMGVVVALMI